MGAYAGAVEIECDGCGKQLFDTSEVYCLDCREPVNISDAAVEILEGLKSDAAGLRKEVADIRVAIDVLIDSGLIAPVHVRDQLREISDRLGRLDH